MRQQGAQRQGGAGINEDRLSSDEARWRQALYFQAWLIGGMATYWVIYMILLLTVLDGFTPAPLIASGALLFVHLVVLRLTSRRPSEAERSRLSALALVLGAPCFAVVHPNIQPLWLSLVKHMPGPCDHDGGISFCQRVGDFDYRTDGPLIFQWYMIYHILIQLKAKHAVFASMASTVIYYGLLMFGGTAVDYIDVVVVVLPVILALLTKRAAERQNDHLDAAIDKLEQRAEDEQTMRIEAELQARQEDRQRQAPAPTPAREPARPEPRPSGAQAAAPEASAEGSATLAQLAEVGFSVADNTVQLAGNDSGTLTTSFNLSQDSSSVSVSQRSRRPPPPPPPAPPPPLGGAQRQRCATEEVGVQTAGHMRDGATQTWIAWQRDGFHCTRCSKPPLLPRRSAAAAAASRVQLRSVTDSASEAGSETGDASDCDGSEASQGGWGGGGGGGGRCTLRFPSLHRTPRRSEQILLLSCALAWNVRMRPGTCCVLHATTRELQLATMRLQSLPCKNEPYVTAYQCLTCGACAENLMDVCSWCSSERMSKTPHTTTAATTPVSL